jgi:signal-transduction protein with cAMP-binding, CBS, and nucleotidyltransferase domain
LFKKAIKGIMKLKMTRSVEGINAEWVKEPITTKDLGLLSFSLHELQFFRKSVATCKTKEIIDSMRLFRYDAGELITRQGELAHYFFIIRSGSCSVLVDGVKQSQLAFGDSFGEIALLHDCLRTASVKTLEKTEVWAIDRNSFKRQIQEHSNADYQTKADFIHKISMFDHLTYEQKDAVIEGLVHMTFEPSDVIVSEGDYSS